MWAQRMCIAGRLAFHLGTYRAVTHRAVWLIRSFGGTSSRGLGSRAIPCNNRPENDLWIVISTSSQCCTVVSLYISAEYATHMTKSSVEGQCFSLSPPSSLSLSLYEWEERKMTPSPSLLIMNKGKLHERHAGWSSTAAATLPVWTRMRTTAVQQRSHRTLLMHPVWTRDNQLHLSPDGHQEHWENSWWTGWLACSVRPVLKILNQMGKSNETHHRAATAPQTCGLSAPSWF